MIVALLLLAAFARADLIDESFEIPASDWRYVPHTATHEPGELDCIFQADRPDAQVRVALVSEADLNLWRVGRDHEELGTSQVGQHGVLRTMLHDPDAYVAIENRGTRPVRVRLRVFLEQPNVRYLSKTRKLAVILISFGFFFGIVTFSARKLFKGIRPAT